jgi:phosphoribosylaminoimidazole-succinocarboxamide synthase
MKLKKPIVDFSTKLEDVDRYLSYNEAKEMAGLADEEFDRLKELVIEVDGLITKEVGKAGLENEDGKIEVAFDESRNFMVVDAVGTPDECRFSMNGFEVSKELLRKYYRKTEWYERVKAYKGKEGWREAVGVPPKLPDNVREGVSNLYRAFCNEVTGKQLFDAPKLKDVVGELKEVLG